MLALAQRMPKRHRVSSVAASKPGQVLQRTSMLSSDVTSHWHSSQAPGLSWEADSCQSWDAWNGSRTAAMTWSPRSSSWRTNSKPMPREAPTMHQVGMLGGRDLLAHGGGYGFGMTQSRRRNWKRTKAALRRRERRKVEYRGRKV